MREPEETSNASPVSRADFLAQMSHEIRAPLNTIVGLSDLLLEANAHGLERRQLEVIRKSSHLLLALIDKIVDLAQLEAQLLQLEPTTFNAHNLISSCVENISAQAHKRGLETILHVESSVPENIVADRGRFEQVLNTFLENSVQYTDQGQVALTVSWHDQKSELDFLLTDTGVGMEDDRFKKLMEGPKLSFILAQKLVEAMGGSLSIKSEVGKGTSLRWSINAQVDQQAPAVINPEICSLSFVGLRTLVFDNHGDSRRILCQYLGELGMTVEAAQDEAEFFQLLESRRCDLAILDFESAGAQLCTWIAKPSNRPAGLRVAIMQKNNSATRPKLRQGNVHHMLKPVHRGRLREMCQHLFPERAPVDASELPSDAFDLRKMDEHFRILVVDDGKDNRYLMRIYLRDQFRDIAFAENGRAAVELAQQKHFDLILMDLQMPEMDGFEATAAIRQHERENGLKTTLIFAVTAHVLPEEKSRAFAAGCNDYIVKPVTKSVILHAISRAKEILGSTEPVQSELGF